MRPGVRAIAFLTASTPTGTGRDPRRLRRLRTRHRGPQERGQAIRAPVPTQNHAAEFRTRTLTLLRHSLAGLRPPVRSSEHRHQCSHLPTLLQDEHARRRAAELPPEHVLLPSIEVPHEVAQLAPRARCKRRRPCTGPGTPRGMDLTNPAPHAAAAPRPACRRLSPNGRGCAAPRWYPTCNPFVQESAIDGTVRSRPHGRSKYLPLELPERLVRSSGSIQLGWADAVVGHALTEGSIPAT